MKEKAYPISLEKQISIMKETIAYQECLLELQEDERKLQTQFQEKLIEQTVTLSKQVEELRIFCKKMTDKLEELGIPYESI